MNISRKLLISYLCLTVLAIGVGLFMLNVSRQIARSLTHNEKHFQEIILAATEAVSFAKRAEGHLMLFLTLRNTEDRKKFPQRCESLKQQIHRLEESVSIAEAKMILARLTAKASEILPAGNAILETYDADLAQKGLFAPTDHDQAITDFCNLTSSVRSLAEELAVFEIEFDTRVQKAAIEKAETLQRLALLVLLLGTALTISGGILVVRKILRPIVRLTTALAEIHKHAPDTSPSLPVESHDEVGSLTDSFNRMIEMRRQSEERFRQLFNCSNDAIMVYALNADGSPGPFIEVNHLACERLGFTREEFVQLTLVDLCPPNKRSEVIAKLTFIPGNDRVTLEMEQLTKAGQPITVETSAHLIALRSQPCVLTVSRNITNRRLLEQQLRQVQKMDAIGQLAGGVAHDFNNIVAGNLLYIDLLLDDPSLPKDTRTTLLELKNNELRAANLTRQLLMFGRRQLLQVSTFNLNDILTKMVRMIGRIIGEDIRLISTSDRPALWIHADASMVEQVILNLCVNARDAMPKGGTLTIKTTEVERSADALRRDPEAQPGRHVCMTFTDTGCGMPPHVLNRIFEPFFTTKGTGKGTGLGLSTVYGIMKQHKGWVDVESIEGKGSTFSVYFPAAHPPQHPAAEPIATRAGSTGNETILLVEDESVVRHSLSVSLQSLGYKVIEAANGSEAVEKWKKAAAEINLLLTDMVMPGGMNGVELAGMLRKDKPGLKVLIASGYSLELQNTEPLTKSNYAILTKPFELNTLASAIRKCLAHETNSPLLTPASHEKSGT